MEVFNNRLGFIKSRNTPSYYAALYLLTSNDALYRRTANCFYYGGIDFSYAALRGISLHNYALLYVAKGLRNAGGVTETVFLRRPTTTGKGGYSRHCRNNSR